MVKKHMKKCSTSLAMKETQIKNTFKIPPRPCYNGYHQEQNNNKCWQGCREKGNFIHCWWKVWRLLKRLKINLSYNPAIPLLKIYPKKCKSHYNKGTCTSMFIAALFTIAKPWKQSKCPTTDEWIKKMWCLYTMKFYSAIKKNEILSFASKWIELENIIFSEVNQVQKAKDCTFSLIYGI
jgi:hypothetical protein